MKKWFLLLLMIFNLLVPPLVMAKVMGDIAIEFKDVTKSSPDFVAINYLSSKNVFSGYEGAVFRPNQSINRAEALKIIFVALGVEVIGEVKVENLFPDVKLNDWFAPYVSSAKLKKIINGNGDGSFSPARKVTRAEFLKMLLEMVGFQKTLWENQQIFNDVPKDAWFAAYLNYAGKSGLLSKDQNNNLHPAQELSRAEVAEIIYLILLIINSKDAQFLITQAEMQLGQIDVYLDNKDITSADRSAKLAVDLTQQALKLKPDNKVVLGIAKIARAESFLVSSFLAVLEGNYPDARSLANQTIVKADEAWQVNSDTQLTAHHLKELANKILMQIEGK